MIKVSIMWKIIIATILLFSHKVNSHSGGTDAYGCHAGSLPYHCHNTKSRLTKIDYPKTDKVKYESNYLREPHITSLELIRYSKNKKYLTQLRALDFKFVPNRATLTCSVTFYTEGIRFGVYNEFYEEECDQIENLLTVNSKQPLLLKEEDMLRVYLPSGIWEVGEYVNETTQH